MTPGILFVLSLAMIACGFALPPVGLLGIGGLVVSLIWAIGRAVSDGASPDAPRANDPRLS